VTCDERAGAQAGVRHTRDRRRPAPHDSGAHTRLASVFHLFLHGLFMLDLLLLFRCFPEVWRGRFGPFLCHFHLLALAFRPSGWGLVSDSGTIACLELLW
jgi:hypothetical protein